MPELMRATTSWRWDCAEAQACTLSTRLLHDRSLEVAGVAIGDAATSRRGTAFESVMQSKTRHSAPNFLRAVAVAEIVCGMALEQDPGRAFGADWNGGGNVMYKLPSPFAVAASRAGDGRADRSAASVVTPSDVGVVGRAPAMARLSSPRRNSGRAIREGCRRQAPRLLPLSGR